MSEQSDNKQPENEEQPIKKASVLAKIWRVARLFLFAYLGVMLLAVLFENKLVYHPSKFSEEDESYIKQSKIEEVDFKSEDGTKLHGLLFPAKNPQGYLLYCHGNAGNVAGRTESANRLCKQYRLTVFVFDYRGFGKSEGDPNEAGVLADGKAASKWLAEHAGVEQSELILFGRSLGGGIAVDLAANQGAKALILQNTFSSLPDVASSSIGWFPFHWIMRNRLDSFSKIAKYKGPLLMSHAAEDKTVPFKTGKKLFDAAIGDKEFIELKGIGHDDFEPKSYNKKLRSFFEKNL